jgi:hydroxyacid-oxoacid transhydrogenase
MNTETIFMMDTSSIKFGPGATQEVGFEMRELGARRVMLVTDPRLRDSQPVRLSLESLRKEGIDVFL